MWFYLIFYGNGEIYRYLFINYYGMRREIKIVGYVFFIIWKVVKNKVMLN